MSVTDVKFIYGLHQDVTVKESGMRGNVRMLGYNDNGMMYLVEVCVVPNQSLVDWYRPEELSPLKMN